MRKNASRSKTIIRAHPLLLFVSSRSIAMFTSVFASERCSLATFADSHLTLLTWLMAQNDRQRQILELVRQRGFVSIDELAGHFAVTPQTVRRDINDLCGQDLLRRYHGG